MNIQEQQPTSNYGVNTVTSIQNVSGYRPMKNIVKQRHILWVLSAQTFSPLVPKLRTTHGVRV